MGGWSVVCFIRLGSKDGKIYGKLNIVKCFAQEAPMFPLDIYCFGYNRFFKNDKDKDKDNSKEQ